MTVLALRALGLGDLLTAVPALRALRRAADGEPLALAVPRPLHPLVAWAGLADIVVDVPAAIDRPPAPPSDPGPVRLAVNLHGQGPQSTEVLRRVHPALLWSYGIAGGPAWDPDEHEVSRWCRLVAHFGCPADPGDLFLRIAHPDPRRARVVVHPGAAGPERRWPADRFAAVAHALAGLGRQVRVTAGPGEENLAAHVAAAAGHGAVTPTGGMDLVALARFVAGSALVICGDTGIAHLATALRTPSVIIFGPQSPARWGPPSSPRHAVLWRPVADPGEPGSPHPALLQVTVADVVDAAVRSLAAATSGRRSAPSPRHP